MLRRVRTAAICGKPDALSADAMRIPDPKRALALAQQIGSNAGRSRGGSEFASEATQMWLTCRPQTTVRICQRFCSLFAAAMQLVLVARFPLLRVKIAFKVSQRRRITIPS